MEEQYLINIILRSPTTYAWTLPREPNVDYKPHGLFLDFLATFICFCVTVTVTFVASK